MQSHSAHIIWQSEEQTAFLVDIPGSIEAAQGGDVVDKLVSCKPLDSPFPSAEPKTQKGWKKLQERAGETRMHSEIAPQALRILKELKSRLGDASFCLPRVESSSLLKTPQKRSHDGSSHACNSSNQASGRKGRDLANFLSSIACHRDNICSASRNWETCFKVADTKHDGGGLLQGIGSKFSKGFFACNLSKEATTVVTSQDEPSPYAFRLPGKSAFLLSQCEEVTLLHRFIRESVAGNRQMTDRFDVILMDPPWPNNSAKRRAAYGLSEDFWSIRDLLLDMPISRYLANSGIVAIWVTNNHTCRELVLGPDGLFDSWGLALQEEWVWVKITQAGDPVLPLDGLWRKPYEILLLGKSKKVVDEDSASVKRRHIFGVPDLHSRKPCLKAIIEQVLLGSTGEYRGLEIFARYLVQGWCSWGNEAIKYNWSGFWHAQNSTK